MNELLPQVKANDMEFAPTRRGLPAGCLIPINRIPFTEKQLSNTIIYEKRCFLAQNA